ncbi:MAG: DUF3796 domain-containing protein [Angelakisella sp.]
MKSRKKAHTRNVSPKLGILGLLGFLGFTGFLPQFLNLTEVLATPSFFFFFTFFGFFGFYYEGKMSNTLIDERFQSNIYRAESIANRVALVIIIMVAILTISVLRLNNYDMLSVLIATIGLAFGLSIFLQSYLLYRFENEE